LEIQRIIRRTGERRELASRLKTIILGGMAKKSSGAIGGASSTSPQSKKPAEKSGRRGTPPSETPQKPSSLLDTRVVYCGDNLE
jgi:hypothetical protein